MKRGEEPIPAMSAGLSHVVLTGLMLALALPPGVAPHHLQPTPEKTAETAPASSSPTAAPPMVAAKPAAPAPPAPSPPAPSPSGPAASPAPPQTPVEASTAEPVVAALPPDEWPEADVIQAKEQCMHLLSGTAAEFDYLPPVRKGPCGLPAPVRLKSIGSEPKVVFDPPVQVNCRMVAALGSWAKSTLQPEARDRLKSEVVRIVGASGYSCRNIYNRRNARLSQHALANAIDIGGFALANGRTVRVLRGWGLTARDIKAQAEAKAKAEAEKAAKAAKSKGATAKADVAAATQTPTDKLPERSKAPGRIEKPARIMTQASLAVPSQQSARSEKPAQQAARTADNALSPRSPKDSQFLRAIHEGACDAFGTVLGPEANDPHRDHFHLDLIVRRGRGYCH